MEERASYDVKREPELRGRQNGGYDSKVQLSKSEETLLFKALDITGEKPAPFLRTAGLLRARKILEDHGISVDTLEEQK